MPPRQPMQLCADQRRQLVKGGAVTLAPARQQPGNFTRLALHLRFLAPGKLGKA
jgi:hypothetical protein